MTVDTHNRRVALLARPGPARDRLGAVLDQAGAQCVLAADPTQLDPAELLEVDAQVVMVVLDAATEEVLERFDAVLADPLVDVIYEEAEHATSREGWDAARWQRHLVAKLQGHANVLPPGHRAEPAGALEPVKVDSGVSAADAYSAFDPLNAEMETWAPSADSVPPPEASLPTGNPAALADPFDFDLSLDASFAVDDPEPQPEHEPAALDDDGIDFEFTLDPEFSAGDPAPGYEPIAMDASPLNEAGGGPLADVPDAAAVAAHGELTLEEHVEGVFRVDSSEFTHRFADDMVDLQQRISSLELVDDTPRPGPEHATGAVLVISGIGGPDAVRQLLGALPKGFARPVLVQQRLDGGRFDKLVAQLQRATSLPVELAAASGFARPGTVYILPAAIGITAAGDGIRFSNDPDENLLAALPSADSAVLLLSGSDPDRVDAALRHAGAGAFVAGQAADGCYDATAANALAARGGEVAMPAALALRLGERWPTQGTENVQA